MNHHDLYTQLKEAYSEQNLNQITSRLIELHKTKQLNKIVGIVTRLEGFESLNSNNFNKCFSKLIFMYHPDKGHQYRNEIDNLYKAGCFEQPDQVTGS